MFVERGRALPRGRRRAAPARHRRRPHPGGTGHRGRAPALAAAVARELPVILAGGLTPANVGSAVLDDPGPGRRRRLGRRGRRGSPASDRARTRSASRCSPSAPVRRASTGRTSRRDRPRSTPACSRPTPPDAGVSTASFGGRYVPETLMAALEGLERAYAEIRHDPRFWADFRERLATYSGRPTPIYRADRLAAETLATARTLRRTATAAASDRLPTTLRLYLKREDLAHTGAHKINNALGQALLTRRLGKSRVIAETGAGQHGVATATACALLDLPCVVFMGAEDIRRQQPNVLRMRALGDRGPAGHERLGDAQGRGQRGDARLGHERRDDPLRARLGDGPASLPDDRPRPPARPRRRVGRAAARPSRAGCPTSSSPASVAGRTRSGSSIGSSASRPSGWPSPRRPATGSRPAVMPRRWPAGRRASSTAAGR